MVPPPVGSPGSRPSSRPTSPTKRSSFPKKTFPSPRSPQRGRRSDRPSWVTNEPPADGKAGGGSQAPPAAPSASATNSETMHDILLRVRNRSGETLLLLCTLDALKPQEQAGTPSTPLQREVLITMTMRDVTSSERRKAAARRLYECAYMAPRADDAELRSLFTPMASFAHKGPRCPCSESLASASRTRDPPEIQTRCTRGAPEVHPESARDALRLGPPPPRPLPEHARGAAQANGLEAFLDSRGLLALAFGDLRFEILEQTCKADEVITTWQWTGSHSGDYHTRLADGSYAALAPTYQTIRTQGGRGRGHGRRLLRLAPAHRGPPAAQASPSTRSVAARSWTTCASGTRRRCGCSCSREGRASSGGARGTRPRPPTRAPPRCGSGSRSWGAGETASLSASSRHLECRRRRVKRRRRSRRRERLPAPAPTPRLLRAGQVALKGEMQAHYQRKVLSQLAYCRGEGVALCEAVDEGGGEALPVMLCSDTFAALVGVEGAARGSRGKAAAAGAVTSDCAAP